MSQSGRDDGKIYRHLRHYQDLDDPVSEARWWAKLSKDKQTNLRQFWRHSSLKAQADQLLDIPSLWQGLRIGMLPKVLAIHCDEVSCVPISGPMAAYHSRKSSATSDTSNRFGHGSMATTLS